MRENRILVGAAYVTTASAAFAAMGACIHIASASLPLEVIVFLRNVFGLVFLAPWLWQRKVSLKTQRIHMHLLRSVVGLAAMYCFFFSIPRLNLAEAVMLNYGIPIYTPLIAWLFMRETTSRSTFVAIALGFVGIGMILQPGTPQWNIGSAAGIAAGFLAAIALTSIRVMSNTEPPARIVFWFAIISIAISALPAALHWQPLSGEMWLLLLLIGLLATIGQLTISKGFQLANAPQVSVFTYSAPLWAGLISWVLWQQIPNALSIAGMLMVLAASLLVMLIRLNKSRKDRLNSAAELQA